MHKKLLRTEQVLEIVPFARRTLHEEVSAGRFPAPIQISPRRVAWDENEVLAWIEARAAQRAGRAA